MRHHKLRGKIQIAVIGGNGFIGRSFIYRLSVFPNVRIFSIDRNTEVFIDTSKSEAIIEQINMEVSDSSAISLFLSAHPVDIIIYAAGYENPTDGLSSYVSEDIEGTLGLFRTLESISRMKLEEDEDKPYFMYLSSYSIYGKYPEGIELTEMNVEIPSNYSGICKRLGEDLVYRVCNTLKVPYCILRLGEVYGKRHPKELSRSGYWPGYLNYYTDKIVKRDAEIEVWSPEAKLDLVNVNYVTKIMSNFIREKVCGVFNVGSGQYTTVLDLVQLIQQKYGENSSILRISDKLNVDSIKVSSSRMQSLIPYDHDKYDLIGFIEENIKVRRFEIARNMALDDVYLEPATADTTAPKAMEAHIARKLRRRESYGRIKKIAGNEFYKIKVGRIQERIKELEEMGPTNVPEDVLKLVTYMTRVRASNASVDVPEIVIKNIEDPSIQIENLERPKVEVAQESKVLKLNLDGPKIELNLDNKRNSPELVEISNEIKKPKKSRKKKLEDK